MISKEIHETTVKEETSPDTVHDIAQSPRSYNLGQTKNNIDKQDSHNPPLEGPLDGFELSSVYLA